MKDLTNSLIPVSRATLQRAAFPTARTLGLRALSARLAHRPCYGRTRIASLVLPAPLRDASATILRPVLCILLACVLGCMFAPSTAQAKGLSVHTSRANVYTSHAGKIVLLPHYKLPAGRNLYKGYSATRNAGKAILSTWFVSKSHRTKL